MNDSLEGKVAIVTGAAAGIGRAVVEALLDAKAMVLAADISEDSLLALENDLSGRSDSLAVHRVDISICHEAEEMVDAAVKRFGRLDILVNNAGVLDLFAGVAETDTDLWNKVMAVNINGPMFAMRRAIPGMIAGGGGVILNVASAAALGGGAAGAAYTASKHALVGLTLNTAWNYEPDNIRCNAIAPGGVKTAIGKSIDPSRLDGRGRNRLMPVQALSPGPLEPKDIAEAIIFLVSPAAKGINGAVIPIDRGWRAI